MLKPILRTLTDIIRENQTTQQSTYVCGIIIPGILSSTVQLSAQGARCKLKNCKWKVKISQFVPSLKKCKVQGARCKVQGAKVQGQKVQVKKVQGEKSASSK